MSDQHWQNNAIQFPRLLAEIVATQALDMPALAEAMNVDVAEVHELLERAQNEWEEIKTGRPADLAAALKDGKIGVVPDPMDGWVARSFGDATRFTASTPEAAALACWAAGQPQEVEQPPADAPRA